MDELIKKYAEILRNAHVGDFTYEGILAEFAREVSNLATDIAIDEIRKAFSGRE